MSTTSESGSGISFSWTPAAIREVFASRLRAQPLVTGGTLAHQAVLSQVLARPDFEPFRAELRIQVLDCNTPAWAIADDGTVRLAGSMCGSASIAAFQLRWALEYALLNRLAPRELAESVRTALCDLAGLHTAISTYRLAGETEQAAIRRAVGVNLGTLLASDQFFELEPGDRCRALADALAGAGFPAAGQALTSRSWAASTLRARAVALFGVAHPAERLLTLGGDDRLLVSETSGLNGYGCSPRPRPWAITFSSSTASSISPQAYAQVEDMRRRMLRAGLAGQLSRCLDDMATGIRRGIDEVLQVEPEAAHVILTASGTDAELIALWLAMGCHAAAPVVSLVIGPEEVGSGSVPAAGGRHFNPISPLGGSVEPGTMVPGFPQGRIRVAMLPVRDDQGDPLPVDTTRRSVTAIIEDAARDGATTLLHLVDCSKTGLMAPDAATVHELARRFEGRVMVAVDAAQMRLSRTMLRGYLAAGFVVLITGSKFFTGPPFAGAVLVPQTTRRALPDLVALPAGLAAYATSSDFPSDFNALTCDLPQRPNVGLLARWCAALWEMSAFYAVPSRERRRIIQRFSETVRARAAELPEIRLRPCPPRNRAPDGGWDSVPTIFTFTLHRAPDGHPVSYEEGRRVYQWLNSDVSASLPADAPAEDRRLAATRCHTPQPVRLARIADGWTAGMRIASGARLVSGVHLDPALGSDSEARLESELADMRLVLGKAAMIARRWADFSVNPPVEERDAAGA